MYSKSRIYSLLEQIGNLEAMAIKAVQQKKELLADVHPKHTLSAANLLHYLAVRTEDIRVLQDDLTDMAVSSLIHSESYTLNNLQKIKFLLYALIGQQQVAFHPSMPDLKMSLDISGRNAAALFGKNSSDREARLMVTLSRNAAGHYDDVENLMLAGMDVARINMAHDDEQVWTQMVTHIKNAERQTGNKVKIYMDLPGPKIRTGEINRLQDPAQGNKFVLLNKGDRIRIVAHLLSEKVKDSELSVVLSLHGILECVRQGERISFDDGKMIGIVQEVGDDHMLIEVVHTPDKGFKLKPGRGVNFPDSDLKLPAITEEDMSKLSFAATYADMIGCSFVQRPEEIYLLQENLKKLHREDMGIILKIETRLAFDRLPSLILAVMRSPNAGIMIARGDLAIEAGLLRMAELQEEISWLAEAAHMPVVWATQVLDRLLKNGIATRAEISDVVKSAGAECVLLNKGPHIIEAVQMVKEIHKRMAYHEKKSRKLLRQLHVAVNFLNDNSKKDVV